MFKRFAMFTRGLYAIQSLFTTIGKLYFQLNNIPLGFFSYVINFTNITYFVNLFSDVYLQVILLRMISFLPLAYPCPSKVPYLLLFHLYFHLFFSVIEPIVFCCCSFVVISQIMVGSVGRPFSKCNRFGIMQKVFLHSPSQHLMFIISVL